MIWGTLRENLFEDVQIKFPFIIKNRVITNNKIKYAQEYVFKISLLRRFDRPSGHYQVNYYLN
jgi:hypothetical protein